MTLSSEPKPRGLIKDFIWIKKNSLSKTFCKNVIEKFNKEPDVYEGCIGSGQNNRVDKSIKDTTDFTLTRSHVWKKEDSIFCEALKIGLDEYNAYLRSINRNGFPNPTFRINDTGYKLQKYKPGGSYKWHHDWSMTNAPVTSRIFTFMWYLNTIEEKDEGYTEFADGTKVQPKCGNLIFFPATWTFLHRGYPPKVEKYLCNGWIHTAPI